MLSKELIKQIILDQRQNFFRKEIGVEREALESVRSKMKLPHIHVITGIRRCGKSTLLRQIAKQFYKNDEFYYLNFEDERLLNFDPTRFNEIYEGLVELFGEKKTFFIDEIQHVKNFDSFIRRFYDNGFKFFLTGSNADLLKKEISTRLTGRHIDTYITPFSFPEFLKFKKIKLTNESIYLTEERANITGHFNEYLLQGGMPEFIRYNDLDIIRQTYDDIVFKDIVARNNIENIANARELFQFMISNFAQRFSYNSVQKNVPTGSSHTIKKYLQFLEDSYLIKMINRFDYSVKKQIANDKKIYVADNGFIKVVSSRPGTDKGWLLENLVANKIGINNQLFYFIGKKECDFVSMSNKTIESVFQVCWELNHSNTDREIKGLIEAMNFFGLQEGLLLTNDQEEEKIIENLRVIIKPVWKWLIETQ